MKTQLSLAAAGENHEAAGLIHGFGDVRFGGTCARAHRDASSI
jgi:hypothetical protein